MNRFSSALVLKNRAIFDSPLGTLFSYRPGGAGRTEPTVLTVGTEV